MESTPSIKPILEDREPMLIIAPPLNDSILTSLFIISERARRGWITHARWLTQSSLRDLGDLRDIIDRYPVVLFVDPPTRFNLEGITNAFSDKRVYSIHSVKPTWLSADVELELDKSVPRTLWGLMGNEPHVDAKSLMFLIVALVHESTVSHQVDRVFDKMPLVDAEVLEYPSIPGLLIMPLHKALSHSISPVVPNVTGNEERAKELVRGLLGRVDVSFGDLSGDKLLELFRDIANELVVSGVYTSYLDKVMSGLIKWKSTKVDTLEILLAIESQLTLWRYIVGVAQPVTNPDTLVSRGDLMGTVDEYLGILGHALNELLRSGKATLNVNEPLPIADRLCSVSTFTNKSFTLEFPKAGWVINCPGAGGDDDLVFNRYGYSMGVRLVGEGEGKGNT
ncbi:hypothetical protein [Vulcanisaeta thermophila]|uniref:hypothetical protein n=1 Tax=Vulcanisaeta thermophila TaxID=867917 RepID=UPI0008532A13|nr:hypothetical protein [Vulcanisaeta thermophila]